MKSIMNLIAFFLTFVALAISTTASLTDNSLATNKSVGIHQILRRSYSLSCPKLSDPKVCSALGIACDENGNVLNANSPNLPKHCGPSQCVCTLVQADQPNPSTSSTGVSSSSMDSIMFSHMYTIMGSTTRVRVPPSFVTGDDEATVTELSTESILVAPLTITMTPASTRSISPSESSAIAYSGLVGPATGPSMVTVYATTILTTSVTPTATTTTNDGNMPLPTFGFSVLPFAILLVHEILM